jgi:hypothetical protein
MKSVLTKNRVAQAIPTIKRHGYSSEGLHDLRIPKMPTVLNITARIIHRIYNNQQVEEVAVSMP